MKLLKSISLVALVFSLAFFMASCSNSSEQQHDNDNQHEEMTHEGHDNDEGHEADHDNDNDEEHASAEHGEGAAFTSAYVCPMHCKDSGSEEEGKCPTCGMAYVALAEHTKNGHTH